MLRRDVVTDLRVGLEAADRAGDDDRAAAPAGQQVRNAGLDGFPDATQIDVDRFFPAVFGHLVELDTGGPDARVGHDDVQSAELLDTAVDRRLERIEVTGRRPRR
jgi:hypothetical protein